MLHTDSAPAFPELRFSAPNQTPVLFDIKIKEKKGACTPEYVFAVSCPNVVIQEIKSQSYNIIERDHLAYLNLFEKLAQDFQLRLPYNRQHQVAQPSFIAPLQAVLSKNLNSQILYGYGDPAVIKVDKSSNQPEAIYYLVATSNDAPNSFPIIWSRDLKNWEFLNFVFPEGQKPAWAADGELISDYWAPEMHQFTDEFRVYFVARDKTTRELCIGLARSGSPVEAFVPDKEPILRGDVIDPHVYVQDAETAYLYWKEDNNAIWPGKLIDLLYQQPGLILQLFAKPEDQVTASFMVTLWPWIQTLEPMERFLITQVFIEAVIEKYLAFYQQLENLMLSQSAVVQQQIREVLKFMKTPMYAQQLAPDGSGLMGECIKILENDLAWEAHLVEGMWVTKQKNKYYLFYAGNDFSTDQYGIGVAIADTPTGPFRKIDTPFLQSTAEWWAPGHPSVVNDPTGKPVLILHAYYPDKAGYKEFRAVLTIGLVFHPDKVELVHP